MPGGDRTGPTGAGPMTGRGAGFCAGYQVPGFANQTMGRGFGGGRGRGGGGGFGGGGRGRRNQYYATGLPGWARGYGGPVNPATANPSGYNPATDQGRAPVGDVEYLKQRARYLKRELEDIDARLQDLQSGDK